MSLNLRTIALAVFSTAAMTLTASQSLAEESSMAQGPDTASTTAASSAAVAPAAAPKWKANMKSYFYDFGGTKASEKAEYEFGLTTLAMQMLTIQYQASADWTFMAIGQHYKNHVITNMFGMSFDDETQGVADTLLLAMHPVVMDGGLMVFADGGVSLPTGSINERNKNNPSSVYAYNMQLGSGTVDGIAGLTTLYFTAAGEQPLQLGSRLSTQVRGGRNANGYALGPQYKADAWVDMPMKYGFTPRVVGYYKHKEAVQGEDSTLPRQPYTEFYYHAQINWDVSAALKYTNQILPSLAVSAEVGAPIAQGMTNYDSAVVSTNYYGNLGLTGTF